MKLDMTKAVRISNPTDINTSSAALSNANHLNLQLAKRVLPGQNVSKENTQGSEAPFQPAPGDSPLKAGAKAAGNLPSSFMNFVSGLGHAIIHPLDSVGGILKTAVGGVSELGRKIGDWTGRPNTSPTTEEEQAFNDFKKAISDRYGSIDKAAHTFETDPFGAGADVVSLLEGGGALAGKTDLLHSYLSKIGGPAAASVSKAGDAVGINKIIESAKNAKIAPFAKKYDAGAAAMFQNEGIKPPLSAITKSPLIQGGEAVVGKGIFGGNITDIANKATSELGAKASELLSKLTENKSSAESVGRTIKQGIQDINASSKKYVDDIVKKVYPEGKISSEALGKLGQDDFKKSELSFEEAQNKIYTEFKSKYGGTTTVPGNTRNMLSEILTKQGKDWYAGIDPKLQKLFEKLSGETDEVKQLRKDGYPEQVIDQTRQKTTVPFDQLQIIKESIGQAMIKFDDPDLKRIYGAISQDLNESVEAADPGAGQRLHEMNAKFHSGRQALESNLSSSITKSSPENIPENILGKNSANTVKAFKDRVSSETFKKYSNEFIRNIFDNSSKDGSLDISKLKKSLSEYDPETVKAWLGDKHDEFSQIIKSLEGIENVRNTSEIKMRQGILSSLVKKDAADIANSLFSGNSPTEIRSVKDAIGKEKFKEVQEYFTKSLFDDAITLNKAGDVDISGTLKKIKTKIGNFDPETLNEILDPNQLKNIGQSIDKLDDYKILDQSLKSGQKMATGSQTEFLRNITSTGAKITTFGLAALTGNLPLILKLSAEAGGEALLAKLFNSESGRKFLTKGISVDGLKNLKGLSLSGSQIALLQEALRYSSLESNQ